jgi:hypothetical protein
VRPDTQVDIMASKGAELGVAQAGLHRHEQQRAIPSPDPRGRPFVPGSFFFSPHHCHPGDLLAARTALGVGRAASLPRRETSGTRDPWPY